jgi:hypothetical protein
MTRTKVPRYSRSATATRIISPCAPVPVDRRRFGFKAGHRRNEKMLMECDPAIDTVLALPDGHMRANMLRLARKHKLRIIHLSKSDVREMMREKGWTPYHR